MANLLLSFIYLAVVLLAGGGGGGGTAAAQDECLPTRCSITGQEIRFPFWLKGRQPDHCGFPGFELSCSADGAIEFELQYPITASTSHIVIPFRVKVRIQEIDYKSQMIAMTYLSTSDCLPRQVPTVNTSAASPFVVVSYYAYEGYTLFNCSPSSNVTEYDTLNGRLIPCLSSPAYKVRSFESERSISDFILPSCAKMYNISYVPSGVLNGEERYDASYSYMHLNWSNPSCGHCEERGKNCRLLKSNATSDETECVDIPIQPGNGSSNKKPVIAGVTVAACIATAIFVVLGVIFVLNKRKKKEEKKFERFLEDYRDLRPIRFSYADIKKITDQFKHKLGRGGYGTVFKGKLSEDIPVAVKVLNNFKGNGEEFMSEVGTIGRIHHINVVRLVGFCADGYKRALVYEFLPNDTLQRFISPGKQGKSLGWEKLQQIAIGIAKGLDYLHQGCNQRILHFDIKPQNILLDHHFSPKVADFGLAKLCSREQSVVSMTAARGTIGYIAPEVFSRNYGNVSYKSDVYSFGMLLLDMVGGRKNFNAGAGDSSEIYYPEWMYNQLEKREEIATQIDEEENRNIFKKLAIVGLWCIQWYPADRPSMKTVIQTLEGENLPIIPPNPFASSNVQNVDANHTSSHGSIFSSEIESISEASERN